MKLLAPWPDQWPAKRIGDIFHIRGGKPAPTAGVSDSDKDDGVPFVRMRDLGRHHITSNLCDYSELLDASFARKEGYIPLPKGTIILPRSGSVALNHRAILGIDAAIVSHICGLVIKNSAEFDASYLFHVLCLMDMKRLSTKTTGLDAISFAALSGVEVPIPHRNGKPDIEVQKRIATILDKADAIRRRRREALRLTDDFLRSLFLEMFGDPVTNPKGWERVPFKDLLVSIDSGWSPLCLDRPAQGDEWGVLKLGAVTRCEYNANENKALPPSVTPDPSIEVKPGDLLFTRKNTYELVAASALVWETPPRLLMSDLIFRLRLHHDARMDSCFLHHLLTCPSKRWEIQGLASGAAASMPNISKARLGSVLIETPPIELQKEFTRQVVTMRRLKTSQRSSSQEAEQLFSSLQQRAFRGEL